jgi:hypothetical protein
MDNMIIEIHTRHGEDFDLCKDKVDHSKTIYENVPHLQDAYRVIAEHIGTDQFLFGYLNKECLEVHEIGKEMYYHLRLPCSLVPLFMHSDPWEEAIHEGTDPSRAFSRRCTPETSTAVFLCPVSPDHVVRKCKYLIDSPDKAEVIKEWPNKAIEATQ